MKKEGNKKNLRYVLIAVVVIIGVIILFYVFNNNEDFDLNDSDKLDEDAVLYSSTQNAVTLDIEDFNFVKLKENFGKLTDMTVSVTNNGVSDIAPMFYISVDDAEIGESYHSEKLVKISNVINASTGVVSHLKVPIDLGIGGIDHNKNVKIVLYNSANQYGKVSVVSINFETKLLNENEGILNSIKKLF